MKQSKSIVYFILILFISCSSLNKQKPFNICKKEIRISGEIISIYNTSSYDRTVEIKNDTCKIKIYQVPNEQELINIPVCKHKNKYYWIMP